MLGTCGTEQEGTGRTLAYFARAFFWELKESPFHYGPRHAERARQVTNAEMQMVLYVVVFFIWHFTIFFPNFWYTKLLLPGSVWSNSSTYK